jgi:hypothetical protein
VKDEQTRPGKSSMSEMLCEEEAMRSPTAALY